MQHTSNKLTVLLIGDNLAARENKTSALRQAGYKILIALNGRDGFRQTRRATPDIVVCEMDVPELSGLELCRMVREDRYLRATPFILVSDGFEQRCRIAEALDAGADDYLPLYFHAEYLVAKVDWLTHQKYAIENMKEQFEMVRSRQLRISNVVKETSVMIKNLDTDFRHCDLGPEGAAAGRGGIDKRLGLGIGMIGAIADLLEEQVNAMNVWEPVPAAAVRTHPTVQ